MQQGESNKHDKIMTAGATLFAKHGYSKTTVDEIVTEAGISKGLFYHYFKNKKALYLHLYNAYTDILSQSIREKVNMEETDFFERLKQIVHLRIDFITEYPNLWVFLYSAYYEEHPDIIPLVKSKNETILQESYESSIANIDWSKLKKELSPENAIKIITWVAEGFIRDVVENNASSNTELYYRFDEYIEYLKTGMYDKGKE